MNKNSPLFDLENGYIVSDENYYVCKGPNKSKITTKEVQKVLFEMVLELDRVFRKNNVGYALAFGSSLGLYNYHGFIPWDDDVDIAIMYEDLPKVIEALNNDLSSDYYFDCYEQNKKYNVFFPTIKVRKKNTEIKERVDFVMKNRIKGHNGLFIDIVALMGVNPILKKQYKLVKKAKRNVLVYSVLDIFGIQNKFIMEKMKKIEKETYEKYDDSEMIGQSPIIPYQDKSGGYIAYPRDIILPFKEYDFNGHMPGISC